MLDPRAFRQVMGTFPTGVTIVATVDGDRQPLGLTVNSFTSVSLDPALILVCIDRGSSSHPHLIEAGVFSVNVLAADQSMLATRFASDPSEGRFAGVAWRAGHSGVPILEGVAGWLACSIHDVFAGGDHSILLGRVETGHAGGPSPLVFHRGALESLEP